MSLTETIDQSKKYLKISKATSGYLEVDLFKNADLNKVIFVIIAFIIARIISVLLFKLMDQMLIMNKAEQ
jgi:hypothetical protein